MKSKYIYRAEFVLGELFILYCMIMHFLNPGTLFSELCSFSNVWLLLGAILIFLGTYRKNHNKSFWFALKKWQKVLFMAVFGAGITISTINLCFIFHPSITKNPDANIVILLGGGIDKNGELPDTVKKRCNIAIDYMNQNPDTILITTGGALKNLPAEAPATKKYLINKGIAADRILVEDQARDTIQNFQYSCKMLSEHFGVPQSQILNTDILVVSSYYHLARSQRLARRMGFTRITGLGSKTPAIKLLDAYSREICAHLKLNLRILLTHKPAKIIDDEYIPSAPDYTNPLMWTTVKGDSNGTGTDVFYVVSTWEEDWSTENGLPCHYADVWNQTHRDHMTIEINKAAAYMAQGNNFYAPFYRHTTIDAWVSRDEKLLKNRARLAMKDVCNAFDNFQNQRDKSRPLIIAGFSQGGMAVVSLLKHIDEKTYSQLAAAYVLGYKVTEEDLSECKFIKPAQREDDIGVTICYNTVKDVKYLIPILNASDVAINPVNWRTDDTPALLNGSITVTLSPKHHVLVVSNYSGDEYKPYRDFINVGDIHSCEPWLYSECLKKNFAVRAQNWRMQNK